MNLSWILTVVIIINCLMSCAAINTSDAQILEDHPSASKLPTISSIVHPQQASPKLQILLPLYIYPNYYDRNKYLWKQVARSAKKVPIIAIINPNNGPNHAPPNRDYQQGIKDLHQAGVKIVGYVSTNYSNRDIQSVKQDIDLYTKYFNIDGIFLDEAANTQAKLSYYRELYQYIKSRSTLDRVIINPGTDLLESYLREPVADLFAIFENDLQAWTNYRPPAYYKKYPSPYFAALIHTAVDRRSMKNTIDRAAKYNFGYIYITNDSTHTTNHNPWDSLPSYWQAEVNYIQQLNAHK